MEENPPLHYLLMHFWTRPFSDPVLGLRLFSALCGVASLAVFYALCRKMIPKQADFAMLLAALSSFWIHFAQDGRIYGMLLLLGLSTALMLLRLHDLWSWGFAAGYASLSVAGLYTHNFFVLFLLGHAAWLVLNRKRLAAWIGVCGFIGLLYLPWLRVVLSQIKLLERASLLTEPLTVHNLCLVVGTMVFDTSFLGFAHEGWTVGLGAAALAGLVALVWSLRRRLDHAALFCLVQTVVPLAGLRLVEAATGHAATQARYLIFVSPFLYILASWGLERPVKGAGTFLRLAVAALFAAGTAGYFAGGVVADPHLRALSDAIAQSTDPRDVIVYLDPYYYLPMRYYYLPGRTHRMAGPDAKIANWEGLPGYRSYMTREELMSLKRCVVVDPRHQMFAGRVGLATGPQVAAVAFR